ncbi:hypothetical protein [Streptomyces sp. I6]|uniref:hypothetical protein n=1 Tax=Streptomyces sp. I6 TaxID=2483113 RepID=UPI000F450B2B|nr:hypothetical protein [Streptomyces sp. I6]RNL72238.1 hypothetical protein EBF04_17050 [Streptomyces sp. I6]
MGLFPLGGIPRRDETIIGAHGEIRGTHGLLPHEISAIEVLVLCLVTDAMSGHLLEVNSCGVRYGE